MLTVQFIVPTSSLFYLACPGGRYSDGCALVCNCVNSPPCDHISGSCTCNAGYMGQRCDMQCVNSWGLDCSNPCQCQNGGTCNHVDGSCACPPGYFGKYCNTSKWTCIIRDLCFFSMYGAVCGYSVCGSQCCQLV